MTELPVVSSIKHHGETIKHDEAIKFLETIKHHDKAIDYEDSENGESLNEFEENELKNTTELSINIEHDEKIDFGVSLANEICKSLNEFEDNKWKTVIDDCFIMIYNKTYPIVLISFDYYKIKFGKNEDENGVLNSYCEYVKHTLLKLKDITVNIHVLSTGINPELRKIDFANADFHHGSYDLSMSISEAREKLLNKRNEKSGNIKPNIKEVCLFKDVIDEIKKAYDVKHNDYIYGIELYNMIEDDDELEEYADRGGGDYITTIDCSFSVYIGNNKFDDYVIINIFDEETKNHRSSGEVILLYNRVNEVITFDNYDDGATDFENELIFVHNKNDYFEAYEKHDDFYAYGDVDVRQTHPKVYKMVFHEIEDTDKNESNESDDSNESNESDDSNESN